jgi:acetyltransferase
VSAVGAYPSQLETRWSARGKSFVIRPIRPSDAPAHGAFFGRLSPEDVRFRFFSAKRELASKQLERLTQIDYAREMALIAVREPSGETVGVARLVCDKDDHAAEFAIAVEPAMKGIGLGSELMRRLIDWGRTRDVHVIVGEILADNQTMLAFIRRLGFTLHRLAEADDVIEARLNLAG